MTSHLTQEMERLFDLSRTLCEGTEVMTNESYELEDGTSVMFVSYDLHEYMLTLEGSGEDLMFSVRSMAIPELFLTLPPPAFVRFGKPIVLEELC
jgi:hypothetical protein